MQIINISCNCKFFYESLIPCKSLFCQTLWQLVELIHTFPILHVIPSLCLFASCYPYPKKTSALHSSVFSSVLFPSVSLSLSLQHSLPPRINIWQPSPKHQWQPLKLLSVKKHSHETSNLVKLSGLEKSVTNMVTVCLRTKKLPCLDYVNKKVF